MSISKPKIHIDATAKDVELFKEKSEFEICKPEIFKYGVMAEEVPDHIEDSDFDYLQSKIPAYELLHDDFISVQNNRIENLSKDDRKQKVISEIIGVAFGIKYTVELLQVSPNMFKKIGIPTKGKYLDYSITHMQKKYELETKGTIGRYYSRFKNDILKKKKDSNSDNVYLKFGTIAMINCPSDNKECRCIIVDDPPNENNNVDESSLQVQLLNYGLFLSYILDSKYYNKFIKPLKIGKIKKVKINKGKFFGKYSFCGKDYYGECFDYRLIREDLDTLKYNDDHNQAFKEKTQKFGVTKLFIGVEESVVDAINSKDLAFFDNYISDWKLIEEFNITKFLDRDGILIIKSKNGEDEELEKIFPEEEVLKRLGYSNNQQLGYAHECGAPCRSREKKGKPCEVRTYRSACHFHR